MQENNRQLLSALTRSGVLLNVSVRYWRSSGTQQLSLPPPIAEVLAAALQLSVPVAAIVFAEVVAGALEVALGVLVPAPSEDIPAALITASKTGAGSEDEDERRSYPV